MTGVNPQIRHTELDLPARPEALVQLSLLMAGDDIDLRAASMLIEGDMALASAVMRAVNASFYGVEGRVQTVLQAAQYLGLREIAALTYEVSLRAAFPPEPLLDAVWARSARRGAIMGRLGQRLGADGWVAHSAGLFEECGKALLVKQAGAQYLPLLRAASDDAALADAEQAAFGVRHDALSSALMQAWGLAWTAVLAVRTRLALHGGAALSDEPLVARVQALSLLAHAMIGRQDPAPVIERAAAPAGFDAALLQRAVDEVAATLARSDVKP
jgi:HD-like signal output (HDOD) protein